MRSILASLLLAGATTRADPQGLAPVTTASDAESRALGAATQAFARDLWSKLSSAEGNVAISPGSIAVAIAMTGCGARGETQAQMLHVLHVETEDALRGFGPLAARWQVATKTVGGAKVAIANRLFGAERFPFEHSYLALVEQGFGAPLERLDYARDPEGARRLINDWVANQTEQRILDLLPPDSIDADARLTLVNAIHFLADWKLPFTRESTRDGDFTQPDGTRVVVPTMHASADFQHAVIDGCEVVQLAYAGGEYAMLFVLPAKGAPASDWLPAGVLAAAAELPSERIGVALPRFKIEMPESLELSGVLRDLGMPLAFDRARADFTAIADPPSPDDRLFIDEVYHKAFVRVDEKGTEAAAATAVVMKRAGAAAPPAKEVRFDRPFAFVLRHLASGAPLFVGRVAAPASTKSP